jgi:AraC family transcriptional regulator
MTPSLDAHLNLRAAMGLCSWTHGWSALLLREYLDQPEEEPFTTAATPDHLFVLVVAGSCHIESLQGGSWKMAKYAVGSLAMTPPGVESTLRWRSTESHRTLQMHLPFALLARQSQELWDRDIADSALPSLLSGRDPLIAATLLALSEALKRGLPNLYAESAAELLGVHLLLQHCRHPVEGYAGRQDPRMRRIREYLRANLATNVSLDGLARYAGLSRFHLLRLFKTRYGMTPLQCLTRLRMDEGRRLLAAGALPNKQDRGPMWL